MAVLSPVNYLTRLFSRRQRRAYEAAGGSGRWTAWTNPAPQAAALAARGTIAQRAQGLAVNNANVSALVNTMVGLMVGSGHIANSADDEADSDFAEWLDQADVHGRSGPELQEAIARSLIISGEALIIFEVIERALRLKVLSPEQLDASKTEETSTRRVIAGVEYDQYDRIAAYWLLPSMPGDPFANIGPSIRVPAADVVHVFRRDFPGQARGVSWLHPIMSISHEADQANDSFLRRMNIGAMVSAVYTRAASAYDTLEGLVPISKPGDAIMTFEAAAGDKMEYWAGPDLNDGPAFLTQQRKNMAAAVGLSYTSVFKDMAESSYAAAKFAQNESRRTADTWRALLINQGLKPIWRKWAFFETLTGNRPAAPASPDWLSPPWPALDPVKEANAERIWLDARLKSRREIVEASGRDFQKVRAEIENDPSPQVQA